MIAQFPLSLGVHCFRADDMRRFAAICGDANPIHLDAAVARGLGAPGAIVHGALTLIWCLDRLAAQLGEVGSVASLRVNFDRFLTEDMPVEACLLSDANGLRRLAARAGDTVVMTALLGLGERPAQQAEAKPTPIFAPTAPLHPSPAAMASMAGQIAPGGTAETWSAAFPHACGMLGVQRVAAIGAASTLVGMVCPGLYSIFNRITLDAIDDDDTSTLGFRTLSVDPAWRRAAIAVWGAGWSGTLIATMRDPPAAP